MRDEETDTFIFVFKVFTFNNLRLIERESKPGLSSFQREKIKEAGLSITVYVQDICTCFPFNITWDLSTPTWRADSKCRYDDSWFPLNCVCYTVQAASTHVNLSTGQENVIITTRGDGIESWRAVGSPKVKTDIEGAPRWSRQDTFFPLKKCHNMFSLKT